MNKGSAAKQTDRAERTPERAAFTEGVHFYYEDGYMVLTSRFLLERGYCCGNGCRHCPYPEEDQVRAQRR